MQGPTQHLELEKAGLAQAREQHTVREECRELGGLLVSQQAACLPALSSPREGGAGGEGSIKHSNG